MNEIKKESDKFACSLIFEGMTSISAVINSSSSNDRKIEKIIYDKAKEKSKSKELGFLLKKSKELGFAVETSDEETISKMTVGNSHGGIIAVCSERHIPLLSDSLSEIKKDGFYVMLEGVEDPYNFGYALRSLYAAGVDGIILSAHNWMGAAGVVARASAGASEMLPMVIDNDGSVAVNFKSVGYSIICAGIRNSISIYESSLKKPLLLIIGGEKRGISSAILSEADEIVRIDYADNSSFRGSLSAASTAAVIGFEVLHKNRISKAE